MADTKISALSAGTVPNNDTTLVGVQSGATIKMTDAQLRQSMTSPLPVLASLQTGMKYKNSQALPTAGNKVTVATLTGAGYIDWLQFTIQSLGFIKDGRVQIYTDGEVLPSVDVDIGTIFGFHYDGSTLSNQPTNPASNDHISTAHATDVLGFTFGTRGSATFQLKFPMPYSNGCIVKLFSPTGIDLTGSTDNVWFAQISYKTGTPPAQWANLRLKSVGFPKITPQTYSNIAQITCVDRPNGAGLLVFHAMVAQGATPTGGQLKYGFLERQFWAQFDASVPSPDVDGVVQAAYVNSGTEDLYGPGYYAGGRANYSQPDAIVTAANNASLTWCASVDFLKRHGGLKFANYIGVGYGRKSDGGNTFLTGHTGAYQTLLYIDKAVPFVPTAPLTPALAGVTTGSATFTWTRPQSDGSDFLTGYTVTMSPGGATTTVAADVLTAAVTGLTNGTTYSAAIVATNSVGNTASPAAVTGVVPAVTTVPAAPTIGTATPGDTQASVAFTPGANGGNPILDYTVTSSPGSLTATGPSSPIVVTGLTNGTSYTFTVKARNFNGLSSASSASSAVTPTGSGILVDDTFVRANASLVGSAVPSGTLAGNSWLQGPGSFSPLIVSNVVKCNTSEAVNTVQGAVVDCAQSDATIDMTATVPSGTAYNWGPAARVTSGSVLISTAMTANVLSLFINGVSRGTSSNTPGTSAHTITLDVRGTAVKVYWDGVQKISYTITGAEDTALGRTNKHGFTFFKGISTNEAGITQVSEVKITS